jgi:hypothetical protein
MPTTPRLSSTPSDGDDLVWSATDAQSRILGAINNATTSLTLYANATLASDYAAGTPLGLKSNT